MNLKQLFSLLLCATMTLTVFTACSGDAPQLLSFMPDVETNADFNGKEFKIIGLYREGIAEVAPLKYENEYSDMLLEHYDRVGKKFNISIVTDSSETIKDDITIKVSTGDKYADIIDDGLSTILELYNSDILMELTQVIDYSELTSGKYGTETQISAATLRRNTGDEHFGFVAAYWGIPTPKFANAGYFNPDFVSIYNLTNPYELLENDEWTWDVFEDMCIAVQSEGYDPADESDDTYGIAEDPDQNYLAKTAFNSNDAHLVFFNEDSGLYEFTLESPNVSETLEWLQDLYNQGGLKLISGKTGNDSIGNVVNDFTEGRSMFMVEHTYHGTTDRESIAYRANFDFSWIPFPKGPSATEYNYGACVSGADRFFGIPSVNADEDVLRVVIPELFSQFEGLDTYEWRDYFSIGMFFSDDSQEWFFKMYDNVTNNYDFLTGFFNSSYTARTIDGDKSIAEVLQSYATIGQREVDEQLNVK